MISIEEEKQIEYLDRLKYELDCKIHEFISDYRLRDNEHRDNLYDVVILWMDDAESITTLARCVELFGANRIAVITLPNPSSAYLHPFVFEYHHYEVPITVAMAALKNQISSATGFEFKLNELMRLEAGVKRACTRSVADMLGSAMIDPHEITIDLLASDMEDIIKDAQERRIIGHES